jgi:vacuolar-type H+-ATPase subunit H
MPDFNSPVLFLFAFFIFISKCKYDIMFFVEQNWEITDIYTGLEQMMEKTYLDKIKEAEEKAGDLLRAAINKSEQIIYDAEKDNLEYERKGTEKIDDQCKKILVIAEQDAARLVQKADIEYAAQCEDLKSTALSNIEKAVRLVMKR